jgi:hypothetical protein
MIYAILKEFGFVVNEVNLGVSPQMSEDKRHGLVHYDNGHGTYHIGFLADKPKNLAHNDREQTESLFRQLDMIGYPATSIEVKRGRGAYLIQRPNASLAAARLRAL